MNESTLAMNERDHRHADIVVVGNGMVGHRFVVELVERGHAGRRSRRRDR